MSITPGTVVTSDRTRRHTLSSGIQDVVRVAGTGVRSHTKSVVAWFITDWITLLQVVLILDVSVAAIVDYAERGVGLEERRN